MLTDDLMYQALVDKDASCEGTFMAAVKTTGIFCRPTCTARKPKKSNVEFFPTAKAAILHGYRPCKVCKPLEMLNETPDRIQAILREISHNPATKFTDLDLTARGIEPSQIRRWFLKNHGMTFHSYQRMLGVAELGDEICRGNPPVVAPTADGVSTGALPLQTHHTFIQQRRMLRINSAFKKIQNGETVTVTAYESGYESLSGFNDSFKSILGVSPSNSKSKQVIDLTRLETPLGTMFACAVAQGICLLEFTDRKMIDRQFESLAKLLDATVLQGTNKHFDVLQEQLNEYFVGKRKGFSVSLFTPGTEFQQAVWQELQNIPYGSTCSYQQQATALKNPKAVRAVANANGMNRICILIPCHRVIGSDGTLTGYAGGLWRKQWLLDLEAKNR